MAEALLKAADVAVGLCIQVKHAPGYWYDARVTGVDRGNGPLRIIAKYTGKYRGWKASDMVVNDRLTSRRFRWRKSKRELALERDVQSTGNNLTGRNEDGTWTLEKIISKRGGKYKVRYLGWSAEHDEYLRAKDIDSDMVAEFEELNDPATEPTPEQVKTPFTLERCKEESAEVLQARIADVRDDLNAWTLDWLTELKRKSVPIADVRVAKHPRPCSADNFKALHAVVMEDARHCHPGEPDDVLAKLRVLPIKAVKGGERPIDSFTVYSDVVLDRIVERAPVELRTPGDVPLTLNYYEGNTAAVKLIAPVTFYCRGHRRADGSPWGGTDAIAKAHVMTLLQDHGAQGSVRFRLDDETFTYKADDRDVYKRAMAGALATKTAIMWPTEYLGDWWRPAAQA